ncbi:MAG: acetylglucosaminyldiphospho-UDP acetyl-beta-D-mannosaminyltransferase [Chloroflexi bacterium]|nr:MAG: acetylglucosaminyldiphospho-UDP acetyl-beta-D-mannosaminyltransferase [Chloroflexota bacterium]
MSNLSKQDEHAPYSGSQRQSRASITILGVPVHNLTYDDALARIRAMIKTKDPHQIVTVNPEFLVIARHNAAFRNVLLNADLALADGVGLQLAALLQGRRFVSRVPGSELVYRLAPIAAAEGWRLFFLGARPGIATRAAAQLQARLPDLQIEVNSADPTPEGTAAALAHVRAARPDILLVAYGAPTQDLWIARHGMTLGVPVMIGVGGTLDFVAGVIPRPPKVWHTLGLEWLYRLWQEPWRWRRQLRLPLFVLLVIFERLRALVRN